MKKLFSQLIILTIALIATLSTAAYASTNAASVRVWSFNMEGWNHQAPKPMQTLYTNFLNQNQIANDINTPDFIATQENYRDTYNYFLLTLQTIKPAANFQQYGRKREGVADKNPDETNAIIYNSTRWTLIPQFAQIQNDLHAVYSHCDVYNRNNTGINSLTCQLLTGHDNYARIITWGIFQEKTNPNNIVIFTSTHHALNTLADQTTQQKQVADITNKLIAEVKNFYPSIKPTVIMAGDYNTPNLDSLRNNFLDTLIGKDDKPAQWNTYLIHPDAILSNAPTSNSINYFSSGGNTVTDHGPIAETVTLDPNTLQPR